MTNKKSLLEMLNQRKIIVPNIDFTEVELKYL